MVGFGNENFQKNLVILDLDDGAFMVGLVALYKEEKRNAKQILALALCCSYSTLIAPEVHEASKH